MSTRCTVSHDKDFHLYQECFENDNVYLTLDEGDWDASIETSAIDWRDDKFKKPRLRLRIDVTMWRKIVDGWSSSHWGESPEEDHRKIELDPNNEWLGVLAAARKKEQNESGT